MTTPTSTPGSNIEVDLRATNPRTDFDVSEDYVLEAREGAIPDGDLTQYSLTDPDGRVTVQSPTAYGANLLSGSNDVPRLYNAIELDTFVYSFDFNASSYSNNATAYFGFGNQPDKTIRGTNAIEAFAGVVVKPVADGDFKFATTIKDPTNGLVETDITEGSVGSDYQIDAEYDVDSNQLTGRVYDNTDTLINETSVGYDGGFTYNQHYALTTFDGGLLTEGSVELSVTNHGFNSV